MKLNAAVQLSRRIIRELHSWKTADVGDVMTYTTKASLGVTVFRRFCKFSSQLSYLWMSCKY